MDRGLAATPNVRSFQRFTAKGLWLPTGSIHGVGLGSIQMVNEAYGTETEKVPYAFDGNNVIAIEEAIQVSPVWTIEGNQYHSRVRALQFMGTKNADVVQSSASAATQTITAVVIGAEYDLGVRNITFTSATVSASAKTRNVDYEVDEKNGLFRVIEGGGISAGDNVLCTYDVAALTRESYTAFNNQNQTGTLKLFGMRSGDGFPNEEGIMVGNLYADSRGDMDPKKHRSWKMKISVAGTPTFLELKT